MLEVHEPYKMCDAFYCALHKKKCGKDALHLLNSRQPSAGKIVKLIDCFIFYWGLLVIFATRVFLYYFIDLPLLFSKRSESVS